MSAKRSASELPGESRLGDRGPGASESANQVAVLKIIGLTSTPPSSSLVHDHRLKGEEAKAPANGTYVLTLLLPDRLLTPHPPHLLGLHRREINALIVCCDGRRG